MGTNIKDIYLNLKEIGCCNRCCLRYLGQKFANFEEPEKALKEVIPSLDEKELIHETSSCSVCLGLLKSDIVKQLLTLSIWQDMKDHETEVYKINFHLPPNMAIREKSIKLHLKHKFTDYFTENNLELNIPHINIVFKQAFKSKIDKFCGKKFDTQSTYQLWITAIHEDNEKEVHVLDVLDPFTFRKRKYLGDKIYSKTAVNNTLETCNEELFMKSFDVPPTFPVSPIRFETEVRIETAPIFFCGRYCKYSRELSQTPWHLDNTEKEEKNGNTFMNCVQDIIFDGIHEVFGLDKEKMTFTASGREDTDVRCLGSGRPFYVKIDSIKKNFPEVMFRELEQVVNKSPDVSIFDMQITDRTGTKEVKFGEEKKKKTYIVLCLIRDESSVDEIVIKINKLGSKNLEIKQMTPIRVAHRRSLIARTKNIHFMKAIKVEGHPNLFQLMIQTQAGTYVKEFIHGDFGRTSPCLSSLVDADVDIFRLDVIGIDLNWPKHINSVPHPDMKLLSVCSGADIENHINSTINVEEKINGTVSMIE